MGSSASTIKIHIDNNTLDPWYCRVGSAVPEDSASHDRFNRDLIAVISSVDPTNDVEANLGSVVSDFLGRKEKFMLIEPGDAAEMEKSEPSSGTCVHVDAVPDDDNRVRVQTLKLEPRTEKLDLALLSKTEGAVNTTNVPLHAQQETPGSALPQDTDSTNKRAIHILNNTPFTWYCSVGSSNVRSVNFYNIRKDLRTAIANIKPSNDTEAKLAMVVADYLVDKLHYRAFSPNQPRVWRQNLGPSWGSCVNVAITNKDTDSVRVRTVVIPRVKNSNLVHSWQNMINYVTNDIVMMNAPMQDPVTESAAAAQGGREDTAALS